jgi:hypothetical protein
MVNELFGWFFVVTGLFVGGCFRVFWGEVWVFRVLRVSMVSGMVMFKHNNHNETVIIIIIIRIIIIMIMIMIIVITILIIILI